MSLTQKQLEEYLIDLFSNRKKEDSNKKYGYCEVIDNNDGTCTLPNGNVVPLDDTNEILAQSLIDGFFIKYDDNTIQKSS